MADWLTNDSCEGASVADDADDWLTDQVDSPVGSNASGSMTAQPHEDWLATTSVEFTSAEVLYGSPCGLAVGLDRLYWCEDTRRVISSQCTLKEIDTFLNNDCNQIYGVEQAELFQNKSLNSFECPRCPCTLTTSKEDELGYYLSCSYCRWDSTSLDVEALGGQPFADEKADKLILRLMGLEKESASDTAIKNLLDPYAGGTRDVAGTKEQRVERRGNLHTKRCNGSDTCIDNDLSVQRGCLAHEKLLLQDVQLCTARLDADAKLSASLAQRIMNPVAQPHSVQQLLPRRKALIPRLCRRSAYSSRIVAKPQTNEEGGVRKGGIERKFELLVLGIEHVPQFCVAEMPDAEDMKLRPTPLMLTVTNPLPNKCDLRFRDCSVAAAEPHIGRKLLPDEPAPGRHRVGSDTSLEVNARLSMMDGKPFADLTIDAKPATVGSSVATNEDSPQDDSCCVVLRSCNRVTIQFLVQSLPSSVPSALCALHCEMTTDGEITEFTTYIQLSP